MPNIDIYQRLKEVFLAILIVLGILAIPLIRSWSDPFAGTKTIYVSAEGKVTATPDIAKGDFSVSATAGGSEQVQDEVNKKMNKAISELKSLGIDEKDIKTTSYDLTPIWYSDPTKGIKPWISGYTFKETISVKLRDFKKISDVLARLADSGINQVGGLTFDIEDQEKYLREARDQAFDKAFAKAKEMAAKNGVKLKRVVNFSESPYGPIPLYASAQGGKSEVGGVTPPSIEPGSQEVKVQVTVTYEIE